MSIEREYDAEHVGKRIRKIRKAHGLSQSQFVRACGGGSVTGLSNWEQGRSRPKIDAAEKIIDAFDLTLDYLYLGRMHTLRHGVATQLIGLLDAEE
jgi:transcriptional regulator with XRE-family HTH domain